MNAVRKTCRITRLTRVEGRAIFDRTVRRALHMSSAEFLRKWNAGEFRDPDHEVLRYDWHPESQEGGRLVSFPHLHVHAGRSVGRWLHKVHLPTGQVEVESVLALLLRDLGVRARRRDWKRILQQAGARFED